MNIPAPTPLGTRPTFALGAPFGHVFAPLWERASRGGACPVVMHTLGPEIERARLGPRELRDATCASLASIGFDHPWGIGGVVREADDAAQFATAGFTWFTFDLRHLVNRRAPHMSLDELDAAIVALEDARCFPPDWHAEYLDRTFETIPPLTFSDEDLARAAVAFGPALAHAEQLQQAVRACWAGRGGLPDIEISIAGTRYPTTPAETLFIALQLRGRGIVASTFSPSLGGAWPLGAATSFSTEEIHAAISAHQSACTAGGIAKTGIHFAAGKESALAGLGGLHRDEHMDAWLEALRLAAADDPQLFRAWLAASRDSFMLARGDQPVELGDDDARSLPEVGDDSLAATFLETPQGRQLLLATLDEVRASESGARLGEFLSGRARP